MKYALLFLRALSRRYFTHRHTWEDAEKDCREHSAHLSSVISASEQEFINGVYVHANMCVSPRIVYNFIVCLFLNAEGGYGSQSMTKSDRSVSKYNNTFLFLMKYVYLKVKYRFKIFISAPRSNNSNRPYCNNTFFPRSGS